MPTIRLVDDAITNLRHSERLKLGTSFSEVVNMEPRKMPSLAQRRLEEGSL